MLNLAHQLDYQLGIGFAVEQVDRALRDGKARHAHAVVLLVRLQAAAHRRRTFSSQVQHRALLGATAQPGHATRHGAGHVDHHEGLAAVGVAIKHAAGAGRQHAFDQLVGRLVVVGQLVGKHCSQRQRRRFGLCRRLQQLDQCVAAVALCQVVCIEVFRRPDRHVHDQRADLERKPCRLHLHACIGHDDQAGSRVTLAQFDGHGAHTAGTETHDGSGAGRLPAAPGLAQSLDHVDRATGHQLAHGEPAFEPRTGQVQFSRFALRFEARGDLGRRDELQARYRAVGADDGHDQRATHELARDPQRIVVAHHTQTAQIDASGVFQHHIVVL